MRYKLTIAYDGTHYCGWQVQANGTSIQSLVQKALETALRHPTDLTGSGRTDAGVHARGQTAHFDTDQDTSRLILSLNALLPPDIRIFRIDPVSSDFHARYSAKGKVYHYHLHLDPVADPFKKLYCHQVFGKFDLKRLKDGIFYFLGTHDFISFANVKEEIQTDTVRTIDRIDVVEEKGGIRLEFEGEGFLYKMVRNITGTLIDIAAGRMEPSDVEKILQQKDRKRAGMAAPAQGLFLHEVKYQ